MKLSIIVPSIRPDNLERLYQSIFKSFSQPFEMIVISPYLRKILPPEIKWIQSHRSPNACQQQGLMLATGGYITFAADDGIFLPGALDNALDMAEERTIIVGKYLEGNNPHPDMNKEAYYKFGYHKAYQLKGVPADGLIFNCGIISRKFMLELGGYDAQNFQTTTIGHADLSIRAKKAGAEMVLMDSPLFKCSHEPGRSGSHAPVHNATKTDLKNFSKIYAKPNDRINIPLDNWEKTEPIWKERFK